MNFPRTVYDKLSMALNRTDTLMKDNTVLTERDYNSYTAIIKQDGPWWIGWIEEIHGVNCQERSYEELIMSLKETLTEALHLNRKEALQDAGGTYREERIMVPV